MTECIIGLGPGRCGTHSLAKMLGVRHEPRPLLPWVPTAGTTNSAPWVPCRAVAFYLLNYVPEYPEGTTFFVLKRDKPSWLRSYIQKLRNCNPFDPDCPPMPAWSGGGDWRACYPNYPGLALPEALCRFYDEYYAQAEEWGLPIYSTSQLNRPASMGLGDVKPVHSNRQRYRDGN